VLDWWGGACRRGEGEHRGHNEQGNCQQREHHRAAATVWDVVHWEFGLFRA